MQLAARHETALIAAAAQSCLRRLERDVLGHAGSMFDGIREHLSVPGSQSRLWLAARTGALLGAPRNAAGVWGATCELVHNASLIHDDLQDKSPLRRGQPALWAGHGANQAICGGDYLLTAAFHLLSYIEDPNAASRLSAVLSRTTLRVIAGQSWELDWQAGRGQAFNQYVKIVRGKAGALFALPLAGMLELVHASSNETERVETAAECFGAAYQCFDDMRDLFAVPAEETDLAKGALNAGLVLSLSSLAEPEAEALAQFLRSGNRGKREVQTWVERIRSAGIAQECLSEIHKLKDVALESLRYGPAQIAQLIEGMFVSISSDAHRLAESVSTDGTDQGLQAA